MISLDWVISIVALIWLFITAVIILLKHQPLSPIWTWFPLMLAMAIRVLSGQAVLMAAAVLVVMVVSERRHLKQKLLEAMILAAGIIAIGFVFFSSDIPTESGIGGVVVFWIAWELHFIPGEDALTLITCVLLWPNVEYLLSYLTAGLIWSTVVRFRFGGWLKAHAMPTPAIIAFSGVIYLSYQLVLLTQK